jgi:hypothetical protein
MEQIAIGTTNEFDPPVTVAVRMTVAPTQTSVTAGDTEINASRSTSTLATLLIA